MTIAGGPLVAMWFLTWASTGLAGMVLVPVACELERRWLCWAAVVCVAVFAAASICALGFIAWLIWHAAP